MRAKNGLAAEWGEVLGALEDRVVHLQEPLANCPDVTLQKTEKDFSPTTRYKDYAISERLFHWESQASTSVASDTGQRYLHHEQRGTRVLLFVRESKSDGTGRTMPYFCAGFARYVSHEADRPIAITWELDRALPGDRFVAYRAAVA